MATTSPPPARSYAAVQARYDRRAVAAYEVMGARWQRFLEAKEELLALRRGSREWHLAAERSYRLGLRSTHAYYVWTRGHRAAATGGEHATPRLRLRRELQSLL